MAVYRTSRCPHCSYALESFTPTAKERIGPPVINCPMCDKPIKTDMKYWSQFSSTEKSWYFISQGFIILYTIFAYSLGGGVIVSLIPGVPIEVGISAAVIIAVVVLWLCIKKNIEVMALKEGDNPYFGEQPSNNQKIAYQNAKQYREKKWL